MVLLWLEDMLEKKALVVVIQAMAVAVVKEMAERVAAKV